MTTEETLTGLREMATYDCGFEEQSDIALAAADVIVTLLVEVTSLRKQLDAAVEDLYIACKGAPCNSGVCVAKNCKGNIIPCHFEWRGAERGE